MLQNKNVTKVLSLLIAVALWAYVIAVENPPTTLRIDNVPVELLNIDALTKNRLAILEGDNAMVSVTVVGTRANIAEFSDQIKVTADVFGYKAGDSYVSVEVLLPRSLSYTEVRPSRVLVKVENLVAVHKPVSIEFTGEAELGTEPGNITVQPDQIEVKGPQSLVEAVSYVGVEVPYSQISRWGSSLQLDAVAVDADGEVVPRVKLSSETVHVGATMYNTKTVPIFVEIIGEVSGKYEVTMLEVPDTIRIRGSRSSLADIETVIAAPIDISGVETTSELKVQPLLPSGVEIARSASGIHVKIGIKGITKSSFEYFSQEIGIQGVGEGLDAYINTPSIMLVVAGKEATLEAVGKEDFLLYIDLKDLTEGTHVVPVVVISEIDLNSMELSPEEVHVTISEGAGEEIIDEETAGEDP